MTNICRLVVITFLLNQVPALAFDQRYLWSQEWSNDFSSFIPNDETLAPFLFGISFEGSVPQNENEAQLFSLGSVKKIITAATALRELGSNYRFSNEFTGDFDSAQNIIFSPTFSVSGDPTWAHSAYDETVFTRILKITTELKKLKIKAVVGKIQINLLGSAIAHFHRPSEWKKEWLLECYAGLPTVVTLNGNCAELAVNSLKNIRWTTPGVSTPIENNLVAAASNSYEIIPVLDSLGKVEKYIFKGGFATRAIEMLPVHDNEDWLKNIFIQQLKLSGIDYRESAVQRLPSKLLSPFYVDLSSKTLKEILVPFLQDSINLVGDRLHIEAPQDFITLASLLSDPREYQNVSIFDGSGLIAANRMTPKTLLHILKALPSQAYFQELYAGFPVSGVSGTLQGRMADALLKSRVHAKTGTLDRVANLAGYWTKSDQTLEPFVIFTESDSAASTARAKIDAKVAEFARKN